MSETMPARPDAPAIGARMDAGPRVVNPSRGPSRDGADPLAGHARTVRARADTDHTIHVLASRQHGVVTRAQLHAAGVGADAVDRRVRRGLLQRLHRGVYRVGPIAGPRTPEMAAVLACGDSAVLSHRSAAALLAIAGRDRSRPIDVTITRGRADPGRGLRVHRSRALDVDEVTTIDGIPVTTAERTLLDLASTAGRRELEGGLGEAYVRGLTVPAAVRALLDRHPRRHGTRALRALLAAEAGPALTRSQAEDRFLALVRRARLRAPEANASVEGLEVDFYWRAERFAVEIDGFTYHAPAQRFERDRRRDRRLAAAGIAVIRVTARQLRTEPESVLAELAAALALRSRGSECASIGRTWRRRTLP